MLLTRATHRFSVAEYDQMIDQGILTENDRVELIRGEILKKMSIVEPHAACVKRLIQLLVGLFGSRTCLGAQDPVRLEDSEPEPDLSLLKKRDDFYAGCHPGPEDIFLLVEVADSSLEFDRGVKIPIYAENGIVESWIVNLIDKTLEVYRNPQGGAYADTLVLRAGDQVELLSLPGTLISVADVLGIK